MFAEDHSQRLWCGRDHRRRACARTLCGAHLRAADSGRLLRKYRWTATFVSLHEPTPRRELPQVSVVTPQPIVQVPDLPLIEIPTDAPAGLARDQLFLYRRHRRPLRKPRTEAHQSWCRRLNMSVSLRPDIRLSHGG